MSRGLSAVTIVFVLSLVGTSVGAEPLSDPTRPPVRSVDPDRPVEEEPGTPLELQAVFFAEGRRLAIVNDQRVEPGDIVLAARVIEIGRDHILLSRDGETIELELVRENVKRLRPAVSSPIEIAREPAPLRLDESAAQDLPAAPEAIAAEGIE